MRIFKCVMSRNVQNGWPGHNGVHALSHAVKVFVIDHVNAVEMLPCALVIIKKFNSADPMNVVSIATL